MGCTPSRRSSQVGFAAVTRLRRIAPRFAVISVGADSSFGHPDEVTIDKLRAIQTHRTAQLDRVEVVSDEERY